MRKMQKLYRHTRGPYKTSKFGKLVSEARDGLIAVLQKHPEHHILDPWMAGMERDRERPEHGSCVEDFNRSDALQNLLSQKGNSPETLPCFMLVFVLAL